MIRFLSCLVVVLVSMVGSWAQSLGRWSEPQTMPTHAIHAVTLPNGEVLIWDRKASTYRWNVPSGSFTAVSLPPFNTFCTGHVVMRDGRVLLAGGHIINYVGLRNVAMYDWRSDSWSDLGLMTDGRWYPTLTLMPDGKTTVVTGGQINLNVGVSRLTEVVDGQTRQLRALNSAQTDMPLYPHVVAVSDAEVYVAGPYRQTFFINIGGGGAIRNSIRLASYRSYNSFSFFAPNRIVSLSGGNPPIRDGEILLLNDARNAATGSPSALMGTQRRNQTATILPNGKVLIVGGSSGPGLSNPAYPVFTTELYDPVTNTFEVLAPTSATGDMRSYRGYHANAFLLADGRVVSTAGDDPEDPNVRAPSYQVFEPPYLFAGTRPEVTSAPEHGVIGASIKLTLASESPVSRVTAISMGSSTHANDMAERFLDLQFAQVGNELTVSIPADPAVVIPQRYRVFVLNSAGVPSVGRTIQLDFMPPAPEEVAFNSGANVLSWRTPAAGHTGLVVQRSTDGRAWTDHQTLAPELTQLEVASAAASPVYYRLVAERGGFRSLPSRAVRVAEAKGAVLFDAPAIVAETTDWIMLRVRALEAVTGAPVVGREVRFRLGSTDLGRTVTDENGDAIFGHIVALGEPSRSWQARLVGDSEYSDATADSTLTVNRMNTTLVAVNRVSKIGNRVWLSATLTNKYGQAIVGQVVQFSVDGVFAKSKDTDANGFATTEWLVNDSTLAVRKIEAVLPANADFNGSTSTADLVLQPVATTLRATASTTQFGWSTNLSANIRRTVNGTLLGGLPISFVVDGAVVGTATTDTQGNATYRWFVDAIPGTKTLEVRFAGDALNLPGAANTTFTVNKADPFLSVPARSGRVGGLINLQVKMSLGQTPIVGRTVEFWVNGVMLGTVVTDATGTALCPHRLPSVAGTSSFEVRFAGDATYKAASKSASITINP